MLGLFFDISILTVITLSALLGFRKGVFRSITGILRTIICMVLAGVISGPFAHLISDYSTFDESMTSHIAAGLDSAVADSTLFETLPDDIHVLILNGAHSITQEIADGAGRFIMIILAFFILLVFFRILSSIFTNLSIFSNRHSPVGCLNGLLGFFVGAFKGYLIVCLLMLLMIPVLAILGPELSFSIIDGFRASYTGPYLFLHNPLLHLLNLF